MACNNNSLYASLCTHPSTNSLRQAKQQIIKRNKKNLSPDNLEMGQSPTTLSTFLSLHENLQQLAHERLNKSWKCRKYHWTPSRLSLNTLVLAQNSGREATTNLLTIATINV